MNDQTKGHGSIGKKVFEDVRELARLEVELAKSELASKTQKTALGVGLFVVAILSGVLLIATLVTAVILAVALVVPGWAAALVVAGLLALFAGACVLIGIKCLRSAAQPLPKQAIETTKENVEWLKTRLKSVRK